MHNYGGWMPECPILGKKSILLAQRMVIKNVMMMYRIKVLVPWSVFFHNWKEEWDEDVYQKILSVQVFLKIDFWTSILNESEKEKCDDDLCEKGLRSVVMAYMRKVLGVWWLLIWENALGAWWRGKREKS